MRGIGETGEEFRNRARVGPETRPGFYGCGEQFKENDIAPSHQVAPGVGNCSGGTGGRIKIRVVALLSHHLGNGERVKEQF